MSLVRKIKAKKRRASQVLLQKLGKADKTEDEEFDALVAFFDQLCAETKGICEQAAEFAQARLQYAKAAEYHLQGFAEFFAPKDGEQPDATSAAARAAARCAAATATALEERELQLYGEHCVGRMETLLLEEFPRIRADVKSWRQLRTDRDSYTRRRAASIEKAKKKEESALAKGKTPVPHKEAPEVVKLSRKLDATSESFADLDRRLKRQLTRMKETRRDVLLSVFAGTVCAHGAFMHGGGARLWEVAAAFGAKPRAALEASPLATLPAAQRALGLAPARDVSFARVAGEAKERSGEQPVAVSVPIEVPPQPGTPPTSDEEEGEEEDDDNEDQPPPPPAAPARRKSLPPPGMGDSSDGDDDDDDDDDDDVAAPPPPPPAARPQKPARRPSLTRASPPPPPDSDSDGD